MPSACDAIIDSSSDSNKIEVAAPSQAALPSNGTSNSGGDSNSNGAAKSGFIEEDVDYEMPIAKNVQPLGDATASETSKSSESQTNGGETTSTTTITATEQNDDFIFIQDTGFNIKIVAPGTEAFELQVCGVFSRQASILLCF